MLKRHLPLLLLAGALALSGCARTVPRYSSGSGTPPPTSSLAQSLVEDATDTSLQPTVPPATPAPEFVDGRAVITVDSFAQEIPIDRRLFGTNVPAWLGPSRFHDDDILARTQSLGSSVLRLPGGSWSNSYDWLACEQGDDQGCYWTWAARPTDFLDLIRATGQEAMWTVSINGTAKEAAALVAFFNGSVDDTTPIGVDGRGRDWKTVGHWAQLRADNGNPDPQPIKLWEVGNEVYGGNIDSGTDCADWGWEDVWTCDGTEYMRGMNDGAVHHEGYLEFRAAMKAVDPTIMVGAVGVPYPDDWANWGNEVIREGGANLDFYVVHYYAFDQQPETVDQILASPQQIWSEVMNSINASSNSLAGGRRIPVAVTEYNLVAFQDLDNEQMMLRAVNALFMADMIGQMAENGVAMANQWALMNGRADNATDYGLMDADSGQPAPQYYALALWSRFADSLLPVKSPLPATTTLSVYAGASAGGTLSLMAINKTGEPIDAQIRIDGIDGVYTASADTIAADALDSLEVTFNGVSEPAVDLLDAPSQALGPVTLPLDYTFAPYSVTLLHLSPLP